MIWAKSWEDCPEYVGLEDRDGVCRWIKRPEWPGAYILHPTSRSGEYGFRVRGLFRPTDEIIPGPDGPVWIWKEEE